MSHKEDLYVVLEILRTASETDIKKAFRRLARRYHPDINPGDTIAEERFKRISEAYEVLGDQAKRHFYDQNGFYVEGVLEQATNSGSWGIHFKGFDLESSRARELFARLHERRKMRRDPERGADLEYPLAIGFADSIRGVQMRIQIQRRHSCTACRGTGLASGERGTVCPSCAGRGMRSRTKGRLQFEAACDDCAGTGRIETACTDCGGESRNLRVDVLEVQTPPGVTTGSRIRLMGKGDAGRYGGPPGDLFVITNVAPHPFFTRAGDNIHCTLPITFAEAALGAKVEVPTIDGTAVLRIPPGTQNGQLFRMRGKGAPSLMHPGFRGDQFVKANIVVPRIADERSKEILRELGRLNPENPRQGIPGL